MCVCFFVLNWLPVRKKIQLDSDWPVQCSVSWPWCENVSISSLCSHLVWKTAGGPDQVHQKNAESWSAGDKCLCYCKIGFVKESKKLTPLLVSSVGKQQKSFFIDMRLRKNFMCIPLMNVWRLIFICNQFLICSFI